MNRARKHRNVVLIVMRDALGLTQEEAAPRALVDRSTISRCESGEITNDDLIFALMEAYGGISLIDRIVDALQRAKDWYELRQRVGSFLIRVDGNTWAQSMPWEFTTDCEEENFSHGMHDEIHLRRLRKADPSGGLLLRAPGLLRLGVPEQRVEPDRGSFERAAEVGTKETRPGGNLSES